jgi:hypothetical protein
MKFDKLAWLMHTDEELMRLCYEYGIESECELNMSLLIGSGITKLTNRDHVETVLTSFEYDMAYGGA